MISVLSQIYLGLCIAVIGFQIALIAGAPWGEITQGGQQTGPLPFKNRVIAFVSIFILLGMSFSILSVAGLWPHWPVWTAWGALAVQLLSAVLNWITPSKPERRLWAPITSVMFLIAAAVVFTS